MPLGDGGDPAGQRNADIVKWITITSNVDEQSLAACFVGALLYFAYPYVRLGCSMMPPQRVMSLLDMLKITAREFIQSMEYFGRIGRVFFHSSDAVRKEKPEESTIRSLLESADLVETFLTGFRVPATLSSIREMRFTLGQEKVTNEEMGLDTIQIFERFLAEAGDQWLVILRHEHSAYLNDDFAPFGEAVRDCFPRLAEDIDEAAKCLALSRYTASVFHLMRIMEAAIGIVSQKLRVAVDVRVATWNEITTKVTAALNSMPGKTADQKRKKQALGEVVANLTAVRIAWRNEVMHPKRTYSDSEATRIFTHVEGFLLSLAQVI